MRKHFTTVSVLVAFCATLFSFTPFGGHSYTIHLNNKLVAQYYVASKEAIPSITVNRAAVNDQFSVYFNECGKVGKDRKLAIKDDKNNVLKEWSYANAGEEHTPMTCKASEIVSVKQKDSKLKLVYYSREVFEGRVLATINFTDELKARK
jgi:hypothetical protein